MSQHTDGKILPERLREARKRAGLTQVQLANQAGLHPVTVAKWEIGMHQPSELVLRALARELDVSAKWLKGEDGPADPKVVLVKPAKPAKPAKEVPADFSNDLLASAILMADRLASVFDERPSPEKQIELVMKIVKLCQELGVEDAAKLPRKVLFDVG